MVKNGDSQDNVPFNKMKTLGTIRRFLWRLLGIDYDHIVRVVAYTYAKEDTLTYMGHKSYANNAKIFRWGNAAVKIGRYSSVADGVRFVVDQGKHLTEVVSSYPFRNNPLGSKEGITIGNDVWIGQNCTILPGIEIGDGVTVAAGSVVTRNIPPYCIVGGIPAKIIKEKCSREEAAEMAEIAWWNWDDSVVEAREKDFRLTIKEFIEKYGEQKKN